MGTDQRGKVWNGEMENRRKNGTPLFTQLLISPIVDAKGTVVGFLGTHRDITEQRQLEQQLMHSQKMESIGTLAAGIAHEVGNPLASISSIVQVLLRTLSDDFAKDKLGLVQSQVHSITKIITGPCGFFAAVQLPGAADRPCQDADGRGRNRQDGEEGEGVTFVTHVRRQIPLLALVPDQISQVFINILLNAVDALQGRRGDDHGRSGAR